MTEKQAQAFIANLSKEGKLKQMVLLDRIASGPKELAAQFPNFKRLTDCLNSKKQPRKLLRVVVGIAKEV